ncbi:transposase [Elysia marginata]|uniref:Transposase n=1 Tax=Elysia marginata TaxID=1093978 RepID=A0AAV4HV09_9GAST|nr:transposase [Elysia marginata]
MFEPHGPKRLADIVTGDETWFSFFIIPPKRLNRMWVDVQGDRPVVLRPGFQSPKRMFTVFFNYSDPLLFDILPQDSTMTATYYVQNVLSQGLNTSNKVTIARDNAQPFGPVVTLGQPLMGWEWGCASLATHWSGGLKKKKK